jgi:hypothetical protein
MSSKPVSEEVRRNSEDGHPIYEPAAALSMRKIIDKSSYTTTPSNSVPEEGIVFEMWLRSSHTRYYGHCGTYGDSVLPKKRTPQSPFTVKMV